MWVRVLNGDLVNFAQGEMALVNLVSPPSRYALEAWVLNEKFIFGEGPEADCRELQRRLFEAMAIKPQTFDCPSQLAEIQGDK